MANNRLKPICMPSISYRQLSQLYFIHQSQIYNVAEAPSDIFKAAMPTHDVKIMQDAVFQYDELDMPARFYIVNRLIEKRLPMKLYKSRAEAERAISPLVF